MKNRFDVTVDCGNKKRRIKVKFTRAESEAIDVYYRATNNDLRNIDIIEKVEDVITYCAYAAQHEGTGTVKGRVIDFYLERIAGQLALRGSSLVRHV